MPAALLIIDIQYDFLPPDGSLAVAGGLDVLPPTYRLLDDASWDLVIASQDYHPPAHISFASRHGRPPFTTIEVPLPKEVGGGTKVQELWPDHCTQGTHGAEIESGVQERLDKVGAKVVRKGCDLDLDAYSAFAIPLAEKDRSISPVAKLLVDAKITEVFVVGVATDYCVRATVLEALQAAKAAPTPWTVHIVKEGVRGVDAVKSEEVLEELKRAGATVVTMDGHELAKHWR